MGFLKKLGKRIKKGIKMTANMVGKVMRPLSMVSPFLGLAGGLFGRGAGGILGRLGRGVVGGARGMLDPIGTLKSSFGALGAGRGAGRHSGIFSRMGASGPYAGGMNPNYAGSGGLFGGFLPDGVGSIVGRGGGGVVGGQGSIFGGGGGGGGKFLGLNLGRFGQALGPLVQGLGQDRAAREQSKLSEYGYNTTIGDPKATAEWQRLVSSKPEDMAEYKSIIDSSEATRKAAYDETTNNLYSDLASRGVTNSGESIRRAQEVGSQMAAAAADAKLRAMSEALKIKQAAQEALFGAQQARFQGLGDVSQDRVNAISQPYSSAGNVLSALFPAQAQQGSGYEDESMRMLAKLLGYG